MRQEQLGHIFAIIATASIATMMIAAAGVSMYIAAIFKGTTMQQHSKYCHDDDCSSRGSGGLF